MGIKICPNCGGKVSDSRNDCPHCQYIFKVLKKCPDCEEQIDDDLNMCPICGHYFDSNKLDIKINDNNVNLNSDEIIYEENVNDLKCPFCNSEKYNQIGIGLYLCNTCFNKFLDNLSEIKNDNIIKEEQVENIKIKNDNIIKEEQVENIKNKNDNIIKEEQVENIDIKPLTNTIESNTKNRKFDIVYGCIILMNVLFLLSSLVFVSLSRNNPLDVYFTMPLQYLSILVLNIVAVVVEICSIVKLFNGSLTYKLNKLSFKIFLISFSVSTFVLVDTILAFTHCQSWVMGWLTFSFSIAVIIVSFICIIYATLKNKNESWEYKRRFKIAAYLVAFIICISFIGTHIYWLNCEKVFINKLTNELTEVNCFGKNMEEFVIPEGVTSIDDYAFWNCSRLKSIEIPYSVVKIGRYAFCNCYNLKSLEIPGSVYTLGEYIISDCRNLETLKVRFELAGFIFPYYGYSKSLKEINVSGLVFNKLDYFKLDDHDDFTSIIIPKSCYFLDDYKLEMIYNHSTIRYIYYCGTYDEFVAEFGHPSSNLYYIHFFQYSEKEPTEDGNYWHYVDGIPVIWEDN